MPPATGTTPHGLKPSRFVPVAGSPLCRRPNRCAYRPPPCRGGAMTIRQRQWTTIILQTTTRMNNSLLGSRDILYHPAQDRGLLRRRVRHEIHPADSSATTTARNATEYFRWPSFATFPTMVLAQSGFAPGPFAVMRSPSRHERGLSRVFTINSGLPTRIHQVGFFAWRILHVVSCVALWQQ
jgi:hypothetical protein